MAKKRKKPTKAERVADALMTEFVPFCYWHLRCKEFDNGCGAHLAEGHFFKCHFKSLKEAKAGPGVCEDACTIESGGIR